MPDFDALTEWITENITNPQRAKLLTWTEKLATFVHGLEEKVEEAERRGEEADAEAASSAALGEMLRDHRRGIRDLDEVYALLDSDSDSDSD